MPTQDETQVLNGHYTTGQYAGRLVSSVPDAERPAPPINRTISGAAPASPADAAQTYLDNQFKAPESREQIMERKRQQSQGLIDSINKTFDDEVSRKQTIGTERVNMDNAISVLTGNAGGTESVRTRKTVLDANEKEVQAVNNQRAFAVAQVFQKLNDSVDLEARAQLEDATKSAEQVVARRKEAQTSAIENLRLMASSGGVDFDAFASNPKSQKVFKYALDSVGGDETTLRAMFMLNRPKEQLVGEPVRMGNKYVQAYKHPMTGKVTYEQLDLPFDIPPEYSKFQQAPDGSLMAFPDNWDGDPTKIKTVTGADPMKKLQRRSMNLDIQLKNKELNKSDAPTLTYEQREKEAGKVQAQDVAVNRAKEVQSLVKQIKDSGTLSSITGKWELRRGMPGANQDTLATLERLKALLAIDAIKDFKGLGPMSEREFGTASAAASALDVNRTKSGFVSELDRINASMDKVTQGLSAPTGNIIKAPDGSGTDIEIVD